MPVPPESTELNPSFPPALSAQPVLPRRTLLRNAAAAGLLVTPAAGLLSACVGGGGDDEQEQATGEKSAENPLGVDPKAPLEIVIFNGGYGEKYATDIRVDQMQMLGGKPEGTAAPAPRAPASAPSQSGGGTDSMGSTRAIGSCSAGCRPAVLTAIAYAPPRARPKKNPAVISTMEAA